STPIEVPDEVVRFDSPAPLAPVHVRTRLHPTPLRSLGESAPRVPLRVAEPAARALISPERLPVDAFSAHRSGCIPAHVALPFNGNSSLHSGQTHPIRPFRTQPRSRRHSAACAFVLHPVPSKSTWAPPCTAHATTKARSSSPFTGPPSAAI